MLFEQSAIQGAGNVGNRDGIVQADVARQIDLDDLITLPQSLWQIAVDILDRRRIRRRAFGAVAVDEDDWLHQALELSASTATKLRQLRANLVEALVLRGQSRGLFFDEVFRS